MAVITNPAAPPDTLLTLPARPEALRLARQETALVVVDMQNAYASPGGYLDLAGFDISGAAQVIARIATLVATARATGMMVVFFQNGWDAAYVEAGGVPVRGDLDKGRLADDRAYRFLDAYAQNAAHAVMGLPFAGAAEASDAMALHLNRAVIGEMTPRAALNAAAGDLAAILTRQGYQVTRLPDL
jgi:nicotinamidase-related amidase